MINNLKAERREKAIYCYNNCSLILKSLSISLKKKQFDLLVTYSFAMTVDLQLKILSELKLTLSHKQAAIKNILSHIRNFTIGARHK